MHVVLPCHLLVDEGLAVTADALLLGGVTLTDSLLDEEGRQVDAAHEVGEVGAAGAEVDLVEVDLVADDVQLHVEHTDIVELLQHGNDLLLQVAQLLEGNDLTGQGDAALVLGDIPLADDGGDDDLLVQADAGQVDLIVDLQEFLDQDAAVGEIALQLCQVLLQFFLAVAAGHLALVAGDGLDGLAEAGIDHILGDGDLCLSQGDDPLLGSQQACLPGDLCLEGLIHAVGHAAVAAADDGGHDEMLLQDLTVLVHDGGGVVIGGEDHRLLLVLACVLQQFLDQAGIAVALLDLFGNDLNGLAHILTGRGDPGGAGLVGAGHQVHGIARSTQGTDDAQTSGVVA